MKAPHLEAEEERRLIEAAQRDPSRFAELYELHFDRVYAFVVIRVRNRAQAEDVTSEVFHRALANLHRFEWRGVPFAAWLYRLAANAIADLRQRASRETELADSDPAEDPVALRQVEERAALFRLVHELPPDQQRVVVMRFVEQKSIREIAQELRRTQGAVKQLQFRALENLRARMRRAHA